MEKMIDRLSAQVDKLDERLDETNIILARQQEQLEYHIYRTDLSEERLKHLETIVASIQTVLNKIAGGVKLMTWIGSIIGLGLSLLKILEYIKG